MVSYKTLQRWNGVQIRFAALIFACLFAGLFALTYDTPAQAATTLPTKMNFQGRIANSSGNILANGTYNMRFKIWSAASGGTQQWSEDRLVSATQGVTVTNGQFSVQLGSVTSLPASVFASNSLYFEVELPTPASATTSSPVWTEGAMTPRNQLATSAYAYNSETLDGLDSAAFGQLDQNNTFTGNNTFNGTLQGGSSLTLGTAAAQGSLVLNDGNGQAGTLRVADTAGNYTYTIPVTTANDTFCLQTLANCAAGAGVSTVGALDGGTANATGASIVGSTLYLQSASVTNAGLVNTTTQSFAGNKTFTGTVTVSGATTLNDNVTVAASKSIQFVGGATNTRPNSPVEGMVYYDTDTKQLLTFANGKWQADRSSVTKIIAPSNATQTAKDSADAVLTGTADQTLINSALTSAAGGKVYLMEGTILISAAISVPNNTTLAGAGAATLITIPNGQNGTYNAITNTTTGGSGTGVIIQDLRLDGNKANQTSGIMNGIYLDGMGSGTGGAAVQGAKLTNVQSNNWFSGNSSGIYLTSSSNNTLSGNIAQGSQSGMYLISSSNNTLSGNIAQGNTDGIIVGGSNNTITGNTAQGNTNYGFSTGSGSNNTITGNTALGNGTGFLLNVSSNNTITGNTVQGNSTHGINIESSSNNTITGNTVQGNSLIGIILGSSNTNTVSGNNIHDNGLATTNNGIWIDASDSNTVTGNNITDTSASTNNYAINIFNSTSDTNYLADNTLGGGSVNNIGTGTIFANQVNASGQAINRFSGGFAIQSSTGTNLLSTAGTTSVVVGTSDTTGTLLVLDTKTGTGDPAGIAGGMYYNSNAGKFRCYEAGAWKDCVTPASANADTLDSIDSTQFARKDASNTFTNANIFSSTVAVNNTLTVNTANTAALDIQNGSAVSVFKVNTSGSTVSIGTSDTTGTLLVLDTKTDAPDPTGIAGAMYYNSNSGKFRCYENGAWKDCVTAAGASLTANNTFTGTQTLNVSSASAFDIQNGSAVSLFKVNTSASTITVGTSDTTASLFVLDTKTNTTDPTGVDGAMYYNSADGKFRCYQNSAWKDCDGTLAVGALDGGTPNSTGATISGSSLFLQSASATNPGLINTTAQTIAGNKTFTGNMLLQPTTDADNVFEVKRNGGLDILTVDTEIGTDPLEVQVGSNSTVDTVQVNLSLDSSSQFADQGTCGTSTNQGSIYFNTSSQSIRSCINGGWEDVVTTTGLGIILYGIVPDGAATTGTGDLAGAGGYNSGPCKVYVTGTLNTIGWNSCIAYSGGRKVLVAAGTATVSSALTVFQNLCVNSSGVATLVGTANLTETTPALFPAFSVSNPPLCLATIKTASGTANRVGAIYDTRVYTTSTKTFATIATALGLGAMVKNNGTIGQYAPLAANTDLIGGVVVAYSGTTSTAAPNAVIVTNGPVAVKATAGIINGVIKYGATGGYGTAAAAISTATSPYINAGISLNAWSAVPTGAGCAASTVCNGSLFTNLSIN